MSSLLKHRAIPFFALLALSWLAGCHRSDEVGDDRTLEKRSHVETVQPEDRKDAFRP